MKALGELAEALGAQLVGDPEHQVRRVASLAEAGADAVSFLVDRRYRKHLQQTAAGAVIVTADDADAVTGNALVSENPHLTFARAAQLLYPEPREPGRDPAAIIAASASVATDATIGPRAVIEDGAVIGHRVVVDAGVVIGAGVRIGDDCVIRAGAVIAADCQLGRNCRIQSGAVIGSDGFGFARDGRRWERVPQVGGVVIGDDVDVGANTTIDRGAIGDTVIGDGVKIDNLVQIAHNVHIGAHTAMAAAVGVSGSTYIGSYCTIAGMVGIAGHLEIADNVHITGLTQVTKSLREPGVYSSGTGVEPNRSWRRNAARFHQLDDMARRLRALERRLAPDNGDDPAASQDGPATEQQ
ncbi:UDP-3-O-(3-hydroxymyristoyl)glucosamine N-acyltransferase [Aquisalimonas sp. 2447]|uniref:UDP-3-O-(3-hydroxymyristoyl)glucosamine N-acyltransferase n=1 Tax=Aquisalimonas sp. 2447 TaxID=2740807 RepID=UPI0014323263|nr:UDP-3-O-(3-hydroxymyristoyl)glucosamine N-acyltransferase [Aquisalimonas sp. 2447]QIT55589.1 UDP-3-O-(3-hydroxymyristoyl)glucosamine N-acyltransferase [Aquisalimonas sp. 2447]